MEQPVSSAINLVSALFDNKKHIFGQVESSWLYANKHIKLRFFNTSISLCNLFSSQRMDGTWNFHYIHDKIFAFRETANLNYQFVMMFLSSSCNQYLYDGQGTMYVLLHMTPTFPFLKFKSLHGTWSLLHARGTYAYDQTTSACTTSNSNSCSIVFTICGAGPPNYGVKPARNVQVTLYESDIMDEIHKQTPNKRIFVLPSQLNSAEYPSNRRIVQSVGEYITDLTGGPGGQLAADPGIAQFIIDNASNESDQNGLNSMKLVLKGINNISLVNGYLQVAQTITQVDVDAFANRLHLVMLTAAENISTCGLINGRRQFAAHAGTCDLLYASAVPYGTYGNPQSKQCELVARLTLYAQFICALKYAIQRTPCEIYFMPLGGGVFNNHHTWICDALQRAIDTMCPGLCDMTIYILCWKGNGEISKFRAAFS